MHSRRRRSLVIVLGLALVLFALPAQASVLPFWLKIEKVLANTVELGAIAESPTGELWLLERTTGLIRVYVNGKQDTTLTVSVYNTGESGLLGVAFAPDYAASGRAFIFYVDPSRNARVDQVNRGIGTLTLGSQVLALGTLASTGLRPGGGLDVGPDGKLYVSVGDEELPASAQDDAKLTGKVLRANLDGTVPSDNASGTLVFAKGFRNPKGLDLNPKSARANGTVYVSDAGQSASPNASDEINQVRSAGNYAWNNCSGVGCGASYVDPLVAFATSALVGPDAVASNYRAALGSAHQNALAYAAVTSDKIRESFLKGTELDQLDHDAVLFDPAAVTDGNTTPTCPRQNNKLLEGQEGWIYAANKGTNPGVYRIWRDTPGPREVSADGSPFKLTLDKSGSNLTIGWENLGALDAGRPARNAGQQAETYSIWEGTLPITTLDHARLVNSNGTADGPARFTATFTPSSGSHYYLVGAQGDNMDGSLGLKSDGTPRPGPVDYCNTITWGTTVGKCATEFRSPVDGSVLKLMDYNPNSPTYNQAVSISDFRGKVVKIDLSANDCFWCQVQAGQEATNDVKYRDRDFLYVSIFTQYLSSLAAYPDATTCRNAIAAWATTYGTQTPILCDVDLNGDGRGDVTWQYWNGPCGGVPQNFYVDQGNEIYNFVCGAQLSADVENLIKNEVNAMSCE